jgi:hypothetical protein
MFEPLLRQDSEFVDCVRARRTPQSDARFGLAVVSAMEAALESLANRGRAVKIAAP